MGSVGVGVTFHNDCGVRSGRLPAKALPLMPGLVEAMRQMKAFARVMLDPGETRRVTLSIAADDLALVGADGRWQIEHGDVDLWVDAGEGARVAGAFRVV